LVLVDGLLITYQSSKKKGGFFRTNIEVYSMNKMIQRNSQKLIKLSLLAIIPVISLACNSVYADEIDDFIQAKMADKRIPGMQLAVVRNNEIIKTASYGVSNIQHSVSVHDETIFPIASMTKGFFGVAIMQLVEQGKIDLSQPISSYLPDLPKKWQSITVRQLLTHTSGLPRIFSGYIVNLIDAKGPDASWELVQKQSLESQANTKWSYVQTNYILLGKIIDKISGQPYEEFIAQNQLQEVNMPKTEAAGFAGQKYVIPHQSTNYMYERNGDGALKSFSWGISRLMGPAAGMNSTAIELAHYLIALQKGDLFENKSSLETLWTPGKLNNGAMVGRNSRQGYAFGWELIGRTNHPTMHVGGNANSAMIIYPKDNLSIVLLGNLIGSDPRSFMNEIAGFYNSDMKAENGFDLPRTVKPLFLALKTKSYEKAIDVAIDLQESQNIKFGINDVNDWGYILIGQNKKAEALEIFRLNTVLYPENANAYDSLAETYGALGNMEQAVKYYQKALEINPDYANADNIRNMMKANGIKPKH
jgi:CubicO group peptidase (beta-lactamase class C family)